MKEGKKMELVQVLSLIKSGSTPAKISNCYNIPKSTLSHSLAKLKKLGCIDNPGYATWRFLKEVPKVPKDSISSQDGTSKKQIRGHAFIWVIEFLEEGYDWNQIVKNYKKRYVKPKLSFSMICQKKVPRTIFKNRKIWLTKKGLTIYEPLEYHGGSSFSVKGTAVYEMDRLIKDLLKELGQKFQYYTFNCSREHFANVHNQIARQFNNNKQKINVKYDGKSFWIDHSDGVHEEESDNPNTSRQAQNFYEEQVETGFSVTPKKVLEKFAAQDKVLKRSLEVNEKYAEQIALHLVVEEKQLATQKETLKTQKLTQNVLEKMNARLGGLKK